MTHPSQKKAELELRGTIISISVIFESNLMPIVYASNVEQFMPPYDKRLKLKNCTFDQKIKRTQEVLQKFHADLLPDYEKFFEELNSFREFRNLFAHCGFEWLENPRNEFNIWDWTEDETGFQYYTPTRMKLEDAITQCVNYSKSITPPLTRLRNVIELRLKDAHPRIYERLMQGGKPPEEK